jgi:endoglucanase
MGKKLKVPVLEFKKKELVENEAMAFVREMKIGWNVGNSLDAVARSMPEKETDTETAWHNPLITKELIKAVKDAGFKTIRIPVSWHQHVAGEDYIVSRAWMKRIREVVDYCIDLDLKTILNTHHDINKEFIYPDNEHTANAERFVACVWKQIAEEFKEYDDTLLFESLNEPRLAGTPLEWEPDYTIKEVREAVRNINAMNQAFVNSVREAGGKNRDRYLVVTGYADAVEGVLTEDFEMPKDTVENRLILNIHMYRPVRFAFDEEFRENKTDKFEIDDPESIEPINDVIDKAYEKFVTKGIPVIIDEMGAVDKNDNTQSRINYNAYHAAIAKSAGMMNCYWDNGSVDRKADSFALFDRKTAKVLYPEIIEALIVNS